MASKDVPKIRKSRRNPRPAESSDEVIIVYSGVVGGKNVVSEFSEEDIETFLEKSGLPISTKIKIPQKDGSPDNYPEG